MYKFASQMNINTMNRASRMILIEKLVAENVVNSQDQLLALMSKAGMQCTQATLSRDLRTMGISRGFDGRGGARYMLHNRSESARSMTPGHEQDAIVDMNWARGILLIKTQPGFAAAVAIKIDQASRFEIAGTVAGDDTILLIPRDNISNEAVEDCLGIIFSNKK